MAGNKKAHGFFSVLGGLLGAALLIGLIYVAASVLHSPDIQAGAPSETREPVTPLQAGSSTDARTLSGLFGARLPVLPGYALQGQAVNVKRNGETVRKVTLSYDGFTVTAVRPADAAPLLLRGEMELSARDDVTLLGKPAVLAQRGGAYCLYCSDGEASYCIYAPQADEETFFQLLSRLQWTE